MCGRVISALKAQALLNESVGAGYVERNWPPALKASGAWPLASLRQSFLNGSLTRLLDPDAVLRGRIVDWVIKGDFGLASGQGTDGTHERVWFKEVLSPEEVSFETGVYLLTKAKAQALKSGATPGPGPVVTPGPGPSPTPGDDGSGGTPPPKPGTESGAKTRTLRIRGQVPPELWNRLGTKVLPKLKSGTDLKVGVEFSVTAESDQAKAIESDVRQILQDLGLADKIRVE